MSCAASRSASCFRRPTPSTASTGCCRRFTRSTFRCREPLALCDDPDVIGAIFYVMELAKGRPYADGALPDFDTPTRRRMYEQLVDTLADLHVIDPDSAGLGDFGKPGNYFERQVVRWTRQYRNSQTDFVPEMERLIAFLPGIASASSRARRSSTATIASTMSCSTATGR